MLNNFFTSSKSKPNPWPPSGWQDIFDNYKEHAAWYSGDPNQLISIYDKKTGKHWGKDIAEDKKTMIHVPVPADISVTNSDILFSKRPVVSAENKETQKVMDTMLEKIHFFERLPEGAETCSALGGVFCKINWDMRLIDYPFITFVHADCAIPFFKWGFLQEIQFFTIVERDGKDILRHVETYGKGFIKNQLFLGSYENLGIEKPLSFNENTKNLKPIIDTNINDILARYIPNMKPNRKFRGADIGQSDYSGAEGLFDSLDEVYTNWLKDLRACAVKAFIPEDFLIKDENGGYIYNEGQDVFIKYDKDPNADDGIELTQFTANVEQYKITSLELLERIIINAGYSPQTFGLHIEGRAESGTALNIRERKTVNTTEKKTAFWKNNLEEVLFLLLLISKKHFKKNIEVKPINIDITPHIGQDINQLSDTIEKLSRAEAMSTYTKVKTINPNWTEAQTMEEVDRIQKELGTLAEPPTHMGF